MKNQLIRSLIISALTLSVHAQETKPSETLSEVAKEKKLSFVKVKVIIQKKDTLAKILSRFVKDDSVISRKEAMVDKTLKSNPNIKNWRKLEAGEPLFVYLDPIFLDMKKMRTYRDSVKKVSKKIQKKILAKDKKAPAKKWSAFYMASLGTFAQEDGDQASIEFKQNSPVTLGLMYTHYPKKGKYTIASSAYFSYLVAATNNLGSEDIEVPIEIGFNVYYQYPFSKASYNLYAGLDFEKFNTFNLAGVEDDEVITFDENQLGFLTVGFSKAFQLSTRKFLFKGSASYSVFSSRTVSYSDDPDSSTYGGTKIMGFLMSKINDKYFASTLVKYHALEGPSTVSVTRFGVGFGYIF
jgi:hypothetical protein